MALRVLEVQLAADLRETAEEILRDVGAGDVWSEVGGSFGQSVRAVIGSERTGTALDALHDSLSTAGGFRILVMPLDAGFRDPPARVRRRIETDRNPSQP